MSLVFVFSGNSKIRKGAIIVQSRKLEAKDQGFRDEIIINRISEEKGSRGLQRPNHCVVTSLNKFCEV